LTLVLQPFALGPDVVQQRDRWQPPVDSLPLVDVVLRLGGHAQELAFLLPLRCGGGARHRRSLGRLELVLVERLVGRLV
jgi:hypothetical protein